MVHALREAHRVLKAEGLLIDLRPGPVHRRVGRLDGSGRWGLIAAMKEYLDDDRAANAAVKTVLRQRLFRRKAFASIDLRRHIDSLSSFRTWLEEFSTFGDFPPHEWIFQKVENALARASRSTKIVVRGPLEMRVLKKLP
jgi:hypothetical protein